MTEHGLLMKGPLVIATLEGRKIMTRRVVKPQPIITGDNYEWKNLRGHVDDMNRAPLQLYNGLPYGWPGDRLWVRETHYRYGVYEGRMFKPITKGVDFGQFEPRARTSVGWHKRPSIFMPRWASRITLEIVSVRVERLQQIDAADCYREGIREPLPVEKFRELWDSTTTKYSWSLNPWVWVIGFKRENGA